MRDPGAAEKTRILAMKVMLRLGPRAWEPRELNSPGILRLIQAGYLRVIDGRCGCEIVKDALVEWTEAGVFATQALWGFDPQTKEGEL